MDLTAEEMTPEERAALRKKLGMAPDPHPYGAPEGARFWIHATFGLILGIGAIVLGCWLNTRLAP